MPQTLRIITARVPGLLTIGNILPNRQKLLPANAAFFCYVLR
jgi:hypothetical protein